MSKAIQACLIAFLGQFLLVSSVLAETSYVTDKVEITLRSGPSLEDRVIATLTSGARVDVLKQGKGWDLVRTEDGKEGWAMNKYLTQKTPSVLLLQKFESTNIPQIEERNRVLEGSVSALQGEIERVKTEYDALKRASADVTALRRDYLEAKAQLEAASGQIERLTRENAGLRSSEQVKWFLAGAMVIGVSWLTGFFMGRVGRKRASRLY